MTMWRKYLVIPLLVIGTGAFFPHLGIARDNKEIPVQAWTRDINESLPRSGKPLVSYPMIDDGPNQGLPLGGFGSGSIGRTYLGDFARWHIKPGTHIYGKLPANQFSVSWQRPGEKRKSVVLNPDKKSGGLKAWNRGMKGIKGKYSALYPFAWYTYKIEDIPIRLTLKEFSPVIPHNYKETSYPIGIFIWKIENRGKISCNISIMFTFVNMVGWFSSNSKNLPYLANLGNINLPAELPLSDGSIIRGIRFSRQRRGPVINEGDGEMLIASLQNSRVSISRRLTFKASGNGKSLWEDFSKNGVLDEEGESYGTNEYTPIGGAICASVNIKPGERIEIPFLLCWDFPIIKFGHGRIWKRKYTDYFGEDGNNTLRMAREAFRKYKEWEKEITSWQEEILKRRGRKKWYQSMLFNELYYLVDGGTVWTTSSTDGKEHFAYLECFDYPFYNTLDVWFYGSYPLILFWPDLEKSVMRDFCEAIFEINNQKIEIGSTGRISKRKLYGMVPHDLGHPREDPFVMINGYRWQDVNIWKDLNSKFVLLMWRDFILSGGTDHEFLKGGITAMELAIKKLKEFDKNGDMLPENEGVPDQTYDTWIMKGESSYCSILWLAALEALSSIEEIIGRKREAITYSIWAKIARDSIIKKLWNGNYFLYDTSGPYSKCIMSDQMCGIWYASLTGLSGILPEKYIKNALSVIYKINVSGFKKGSMGAVNGQFPGAIPVKTEQAEEVWVGTNYALVSLFFAYNMQKEGWKALKGVYETVWEKYGYWFRTPEAYNGKGDFRASMYMRPGAIWAIELTLERSGE